MAATTETRGSALRVGDTVVTWFGRQTIIALPPYAGPIADLRFARVAEFASGSGMTMLPEMIYDVVRVQEAAA